MKKGIREMIKNKFNGRCAYSGTELEDDWQIDHVKPVIRNQFTSQMHFKKDDNIENMVPCQKIINHYKGNLDLETFRKWFLGGLHERLRKPKNPRTDKSKKRREYQLKVASYFGISEDKPFDGKFYFEKVESYPSPPDNQSGNSHFSINGFLLLIMSMITLMR